MSWGKEYLVPAKITHRDGLFFGVARTEAAIWKNHVYPTDEGRFGLPPKAIKIDAIKSRSCISQDRAREIIEIWIAKHGDGIQCTTLTESEQKIRVVFLINSDLDVKVINPDSGESTIANIEYSHPLGRPEDFHMTLHDLNGHPMTKIVVDDDWYHRKFKANPYTLTSKKDLCLTYL